MQNILSQIQSKLRLGENSEIEFKTAKGGFPKSFWETFSAMANSDGGMIVLGVKESGGQYIPDKMTKDTAAAYRKVFWDNAHNKTCVSVPLLVESDVQEVTTDSGDNMLVFRIPRAPYNLRPVHLTRNPFGHTYVRRHEGDYCCSDDEVRQMLSDANNLRSSADSRILRGYTINDIDLPTLRRFRRAYESRHEGHPWNDDDDQQFLEHIGAFRKDRATSTEGFTVAGILMFGKTNSITDPECCPYYFPDYRERLSDDHSIRWTNRIYPDGTWEVNLYQFYSRVLPMIQHSLPVPFRLDKNQIRVDTTSAHTSLREAFVNCLVHCAYTVMGNIAIDRYPNRIVMSNPGTMLISLNEYEEGGHSVCRNPLLQKMFILLGICERGGSDADVIAKGWNDNGWKPLPHLRECHDPDRVEISLEIPTLPTGNGLIESSTGSLANVVESPINRKNDDNNRKNDDNNHKNDDNNHKNDDNDHKNDDNGIGNNSNLSISDRTRKKIFLYVAEHPGCKSSQIAEYVSLGDSQTKLYLRQLVKEGKIIPQGANKNRTYIART